MTRIGIDFRVERRTLFNQLRDTLRSLFNRSARNNFGDFRPFTEEAINEAVEQVKDQFIPTDEEAAELGVGEGGNIDRERTQGAWRQLLVGGPNSVMNFSVRRSRRTNEIGNIRITYDEDAFLAAPLSNVPTPDSFRIRSIPWMDWLINGAPTNSNFQFTDDFPSAADSRTGQGIMIRGGVWRFAPARPLAFIELNRTIERRVIDAVERLSGEIL